MTTATDAPAVAALATLYRYAAKAAHPDAGGNDDAMRAVNAAVATLRPIVDGTAPPAIAYEPIPFGKHKGTPLGELPITYLTWMLDMEDEFWASAALTVLAHLTGQT